MSKLVLIKPSSTILNGAERPEPAVPCAFPYSNSAVIKRARKVVRNHVVGRSLSSEDRGTCLTASLVQEQRPHSLLLISPENRKEKWPLQGGNL